MWDYGIMGMSHYEIVEFRAVDTFIISYFHNPTISLRSLSERHLDASFADGLYEAIDVFHFPNGGQETRLFS